MKHKKNQPTRRDLLLSSGAATGAVATALAGGLLLTPDSAAAHEVEINAMGPTPEQVQQFLALPEGPIVMVNLLKFKPDGGREEYAKYGMKIAPILEKIGARVLFSGEAKVCLIGSGNWDSVALVEYPDRTALLEMSRSEEYQAIHHHRAAGLAGQVNYAVAQTAGIG